MNVQEVMLGIAFIGAASLAWWIALPRDGAVPAFLRNDQVASDLTSSDTRRLWYWSRQHHYGLVALSEATRKFSN